MKIVIFTLGFVVLIARGSCDGPAEQINNQLNNQINAVKREIKSIASEITSIKKTELSKLSRKILKIAESNKLVIETEEELKNNRGSKKCQKLFKAKLESTVDQIYVRVSDRLTIELTKIEKDLKEINIELDKLKKQLERSHNVGKIAKEINEAAKTVNNLKKKVPVLVPTALTVVEKSTLPKLARENILEPVAKCLKKNEEN